MKFLYQIGIFSFIIIGSVICDNVTKHRVNESVTLVDKIFSQLIKQEMNMAKQQGEILIILEKQTEMLLLLMKNVKNKSQNVSDSSSSPTETLGPAVLPSSPTPTPGPTAMSADWSYSGSSGPDTWAASYPSCGGESQSPVKLETVDVGLKEHELPIMFSSYNQVNSDTCNLVNTGNTINITLTSTPFPHPTISGGPLNATEYRFSQAIFHWGTNDSLGSEHYIRDTTYPLEMQLIHQFSSHGENKMAVTSFLFEVCEEDNPFLAPVINMLDIVQVAGSQVYLNSTVSSRLSMTPDDQDPGAVDSFSMEQLIRESISGPYFSYIGSLTFPPCTKVDQWIVFRIPLDISSIQMKQLRRVQFLDGSKMVNNFRPLQPLGKRLLGFTL